MKHKFETLYARGSTGKVLRWDIEVSRGLHAADIKISYGEYNGNQTVRWQRNVAPKNVGKSNETTSFEQAMAECQSTILKKKRAGYMTLDEVKIMADKEKKAEYDITDFNFIAHDYSTDDTFIMLNKYLPQERKDLSGDVKPMKAQQYYRTKKNWTCPNGEVWKDRKYFYLKNPDAIKETGAVITKFPCIGQYKINGFRSLIRLKDNKVLIKSKDGLTYRIPHITNFFTKYKEIFDGDMVFDGELYIHKEPLGVINSAVNTSNLNSIRLKFVIFDLAIPNMSNLDRWKKLKALLTPIIDSEFDAPIELVRTTVINNDAQAQKFTDIAVENHYEGAIFRDFKAKYAFGKRLVTMTKLKRLIETEFIIVDIIGQKKDRTQGLFVCKTNKGVRFEVTPHGSAAYKTLLLAKKFDHIGKMLTCSFYEYTEAGKPNHIVYNIIRDYE